MVSEDEIREALLALENAPPEGKAAAKSRVTTLSAHAALEIPDTNTRKQFAALLGADIEKAMRA